MADGCHIKNRFGHNSAADCPISVNFCAGKQFFLQKFGNGTDTCVPQNVFLVFLMQFGLRRAAAFRVVSDALVAATLSGQLLETAVIGLCQSNCLRRRTAQLSWY